MAKQNYTLKKRNAGKVQNNNIIVHDLTQVSPDRNRKDIGKLKSALLRAESILLPNRTQLYDIYHDVVTIDGHLSGIMKKREDAVLNKSLKFVDAKGRKIDTMDKLIYSNKFSDLIRLIIQSKYWGISGVEFIVGQEFDYEIVPRKHIQPEKGIIVNSQFANEGIAIDSLPFVWVIGNKNDLGQLLQCCMYAIYKRSGFGDFAQYVEIFGQPVRIIYYDAYDTKTRDELRKILNDSGSSLAMMVPKQAQFQMLDGKTSNGTGELQRGLINACNDEMSVSILGVTETTTSSSSSGYAQAKEQGKQQLEITKSDLAFAQNVLNEPQFINILKSYGYPVEGGSFEFEMELDLDTLKKRLEIDTVVASKVPVDDDYWYTTYGIPRPDNYDELKKKQAEERQAAINAVKTDADNDTETKTDVKITRKEKNLLHRLASFFFGETTVLSLSEYYSGGCTCGYNHNLPPLDSVDNWNSIYTYIARQLLESKLNNGDIPAELYEKTARYLLAGINTGLGGNAFNYNDSRNILKSYLTRNIYSFSAAKSLTEMLEYRNAMYDKKTGDILSFNRFKQAIEEKGKLFNEVWLHTEYDTALQSAIMAHKWDSIQAEYLEFSTVGDNRVRPEHAMLDGKTYPKNHPFWNKFYPPLDWNCRCTVIPGIATKYDDSGDFSFAKNIEVNPIFENNPGKTRVIFNNSHPYFVNNRSEIKNLTYKNYGLKSEEQIRLKGSLPVMRETSLNEYLEWWQTQKKFEGDNIVVTDILGQSILFDSKNTNSNYFKYHILKKKNEERFRYATNFKDIASRPHEVWDNGRFTFYIKYYDKETVALAVDNKTLKAETMYTVKEQRTNQLRQGLLKHKSSQVDT